MKVAVTADTHITSKGKHPERSLALENVCSQANDLQIEHIFLAGDILDKGVSAVGELDRIFSMFSSLTFHMIPGNHDIHLGDEMFTAENVHFYNMPVIKHFAPESIPFLFVPYSPASSMGKLLQKYSQGLHPGKWILVSHGDWTGSLKKGNPLEPGVYMPLTRTDIEIHQPALVLLGHIHQPISSGVIHYPGSPCGLDISETGPRSFIILDTEDISITRRTVETEILFFDETFIITPSEDEVHQFLEILNSRIESWGLTKTTQNKAIIRINLKGYSKNREKLSSAVNKALEGFSFYKEKGPDLTNLLPASDPELAWIARQVTRNIQDLEWHQTPDLPEKEEILLASLSVIYGD
jgi:DNA repair protein SbcD/Mre11